MFLGDYSKSVFIKLLATFLIVFLLSSCDDDDDNGNNGSGTTSTLSLLALADQTIALGSSLSFSLQTEGTPVGEVSYSVSPIPLPENALFDTQTATFLP